MFAGYVRWISTHTLTWSVTLYSLSALWFVLYFNSHAHVERDGSRYPDHLKLNDFNSHAHVERDISAPDIAVTVWHFNSHAHVERDSLRLVKSMSPLISTHTLTWSVTRWWYTATAPLQFQLTRSRGAWQCTLTHKTSFQNFNSHAHVERDEFDLFLVWTHMDISTHTLTWSVTWGCGRQWA